MPYNYLLDAYLLQSYLELLTDSIIIFDEAHNVAEAACEGRSLTLEVNHIEGSINELTAILLAPKVSENLMAIRQNYEKEINFIIRNLEDFKHNFTNFGLENLPPKQELFKR
jgi:Rad3-related DNA helicase